MIRAGRPRVSMLGRQHVRDGIITFRTAKTGTQVTIPLLPELAEIIAATKVGDLAYVATRTSYDEGKLWELVSLGVEGRRGPRCRPRASQGGRDAAANNGATEAEMEAIFSWRGARSLYTRQADRIRLAQDAMRKMARREGSTGSQSSGRMVTIKASRNVRYKLSGRSMKASALASAPPCLPKSRQSRSTGEQAGPLPADIRKCLARLYSAIRNQSDGNDTREALLLTIVHDAIEARAATMQGEIQIDKISPAARSCFDRMTSGTTTLNPPPGSSSNSIPSAFRTCSTAITVDRLRSSVPCSMRWIDF